MKKLVIVAAITSLSILGIAAPASAYSQDHNYRGSWRATAVGWDDGDRERYSATADTRQQAIRRALRECRQEAEYCRITNVQHYGDRDRDRRDRDRHEGRDRDRR